MPGLWLILTTHLGRLCSLLTVAQVQATNEPEPAQKYNTLVCLDHPAPRPSCRPKLRACSACRLEAVAFGFWTTQGLNMKRFNPQIKVHSYLVHKCSSRMNWRWDKPCSIPAPTDGPLKEMTAGRLWEMPDASEMLRAMQSDLRRQQCQEWSTLVYVVLTMLNSWFGRSLQEGNVGSNLTQAWCFFAKQLRHSRGILFIYIYTVMPAKSCQIHCIIHCPSTIGCHLVCLAWHAFKQSQYEARTHLDSWRVPLAACDIPQSVPTKSIGHRSGTLSRLTGTWSQSRRLFLFQSYMFRMPLLNVFVMMKFVSLNNPCQSPPLTNYWCFT